MIKHKKSHCFLKTFLAFSLAAALSLLSTVPAEAAELGIDVSKYQGAINWAAVPASGVTYTFIKVGSTKSGIDPCFAANVLGAQAAGIRTGVYIYSYADSVEAAVNEAVLVLQWIENFNINFPVAFDVEDKVYNKLDPGTITAMCNAFCDVIASAGYHPIVYTGTNFYKKNITPDLRYDIWIAQYNTSCAVPGHAIWQASCTGSIPGIAGSVDINYMYKDYHNLIIPAGFAQRGEYTYFYNNYRLQFGWVDFNNARYHMDAFGRMDTGWLTDETGVYYLAADGHALVGQNQIEQDRFYFDGLGRIQAGWVTVADNQYYYDPGNGCRMLTGWFNDGAGRHYLFPEDGHMLTGLQNIDGQTYYFDGTGKMATGWQNLGGPNFYFDLAGGAMLKGLIPGADGIYGTSQADGHQLINEAAVIDNVLRCFDAEGRLVVNAPYAIGAAIYVCDAGGTAVLVTP